MKRTVLGSNRDPLLLLLLASIGASELSACGGKSESQGAAQRGSPDSAGGDGALPPVGSGGVGGTAGAPANPGGGGDRDNPLTPSAGMPPTDGRPPPEGVVGCNDPTPYPAPYPLPDPPPDTGILSCASPSFIHRAAAQACPAPFMDPPPSPAGCATLDCSSLPHGQCYAAGSPCEGTRCVSECATDAECGADELCLCDAVMNHCVKASCRTDADCGGLLCIATWDSLGAMSPFTCQTPDDECTASCAGYATTTNGQPGYMYGTCNLNQHPDGSHSRDCSYSNNTGGSCGRPFLVQGSALVAEAMKRSDWATALARGLRVDDLVPELRRVLAVSWRDAALMEHASIAAFARFSLELLALGAPPDLVRDAAAAMADEQRHAELCFGLASAYAGAPVGPGPLDVRHCLGDVSLESVAVTTFLEGCIGETLAAVQARELSYRALDPVLEAALSRIAEDESHHAALAWRFLKWALAAAGPALAERLALALETERARLVASEPLPRGISGELALAHGLMPPAASARLRREALDDIVLPCLAALCPPTASGIFHARPLQPKTPAVA